MAGLRRVAEDATRTQVEHTLEILGRVADAGDVALVVVIPEVSVDWSRDRPVPWLPGDGAARWHAAHAKALGALEIGAWPAAAEGRPGHAGARRRVSPTSHRLLGDALAALGRVDEARAAHRDAVDARAWDNVPPIPSATSVVREAILAGADEWDYTCVDLPGLRVVDPGPASATRSSSTTVTWRPTECAWPWAPLPPRSVGSSSLSRGRRRAAPRQARRW